MTQVGVPVESRGDTVGLSYVEWGAVFAGAVLAAALSFVLLTFGTAAKDLGIATELRQMMGSSRNSPPASTSHKSGKGALL